MQPCNFPQHLCTLILHVIPIGPIRAHNPNSISTCSAIFAQMTTVCLYFYNGSPLLPKIAPSHGDLESSGPSSNTRFPGPPESSTQTASRSVQPFLQAHYCDRPTDRSTDNVRYSVGNNRPYLRKYRLVLELSYNDTLKQLGLQQLEGRRTRSDLIETFMIVNRKYIWY